MVIAILYAAEYSSYQMFECKIAVVLERIKHIVIDSDVARMPAATVFAETEVDVAHLLIGAELGIAIYFAEGMQREYWTFVDVESK